MSLPTTPCPCVTPPATSPTGRALSPGDGQLSGVLLMDARSIAATARNHGVVTSAAEVDYPAPAPVRRTFDGGVYGRRVYFGYGKGPTGRPPSTTVPTLPSGPPSRRWGRSCCCRWPPYCGIPSPPPMS